MEPKILMFGWEFPPHNSGGLGTACQGILEALARRQVPTVFVLPKKMDYQTMPVALDFANEDLMAQIKILKINSPLTAYSHPSGLGYVGGENIKLVYGSDLIEEVYRYGAGIDKVASSGRFNVIHGHDWLSVPAGIRAAAISGQPFVYQVHATEYDRTGGQGGHPAVLEIEQEGLTKADKVVAISQRTKQTLMENYKVNPNKIEVVHNGSAYRPKIKKKIASWSAAGFPIVLFAGRLTIQKGPDYFLAAARLALSWRPHLRFIIAGSGDMERKLITQVAEWGLSDKIIFAGFARGQDLDSLYASADLYVLPSVSEPFGLTPLEALACGTPVLVSRQSGVAEILNHALKVDFWDVDDLTAKIITLTDEPAMAQTLKRLGGSEAGEWTWDRSVAGYLNVYKSLLGSI
ncbi:MAG: glycosyltransferase family 4 protein [Patescibacteria group bacterium]